MDLNIEQLFGLRKRVVNEGRAMIKVRYADSRDITTAAVCPACWNNHDRRGYLLKRMSKLGVVTVFNQDGLNGLYLKGKNHLADCPYNDGVDNWQKFKFKQARLKQLRKL